MNYDSLMSSSLSILQYSRPLLEKIKAKESRLDRKELYLSYIFEMAVGLVESAIILNRNEKHKDSMLQARSLFEMFIDAHFLYVSGNESWVVLMVAYNELETIDAIEKNRVLRGGDYTVGEKERLRDARENLDGIYKKGNELPKIGTISQSKDKIIFYDKDRDRYIRKGKGCVNITIYGKAGLVDSTIFSGLKPNQLSQAHYQLIYKYYSQFIHPSLLGMTQYRNGVNRDDPTSEEDIKSLSDIMFYYLFKITKLAQSHIGVEKKIDLDKKFKKELKECDYGELTFPVSFIE